MNRNREAGLTLIELLAVVTILGIIMIVVARNIFSQADTAKARTNIIRLNKVKGALDLYRLEFGKYPSQLVDLTKPSADVAQSGKLFMKYIEEDELQDVWSTPLIYKSEGDGRSFSLTTLGADSAPGGTDAKQDVTVKP